MPHVSSNVYNLGKYESKASTIYSSLVSGSHLMFKLGANTKHLVTPSQILPGVVSFSETVHVSQGLRTNGVKVLDVNNARKRVYAKVKSADEGRLSQASKLAFIKSYRLVQTSIKPSRPHRKPIPLTRKRLLSLTAGTLTKFMGLRLVPRTILSLLVYSLTMSRL